MKVEEKSELIEGVLHRGEMQDRIIYEGIVEDRYWRVLVTDFRLPNFLLTKMFWGTEAQISVPSDFEKGHDEDLVFRYIQPRKDGKADLVWYGFLKGKQEKVITVVVSGVELLGEFSERENYRLLLDAFENSRLNIHCLDWG